MDVAQIKERIGCSSITFRHLPLPAALDKIRDLGFRAVDIGVVPGFCPHIDLRCWTEEDTEHLRTGLASRKLRLSSLNVHIRGMALRDDEDALELFERTMRIGAALGAKGFTLPVGPAVPEANWLAEAKTLAGGIRRLADFGEQLGLKVSVEAPHTGALASNYEQSAKLYQLIGNPRVGATFDTSHGQFNDPRPLVEGIAAIGTEISHVHLRDVLGQSFAVTPGKGTCDFLPFFQALAKQNYQGDFNLELECNADEAAGEARFARDYLDLILQGKALPAEFTQWKSDARRKQARRAQIAKNPKTYITSQGWYGSVKPMARPLIRVARENLPKSYERYESGWKKRYLTRKTRKVPLRKPASESGSGKRVRVALVGCGNIGVNMHGPSFASMAGVELVGVCDTNYELAVAAGKALGCPPFGTLAELVASAKPELAANCTTEAAHSRSSLYLLENGVDVFCEKMMAESLESGERMVKRAAELGRVLAVNFNWRFQPGIAKVRQIKDAGSLGELCLLRFVSHAHLWHHVLDLSNFLGGRANKISAQVRLDPLFEDRRPWRRFADELLYLPGVYANALIETVEGTGVSITSSDLWQPDGYLLNLDAVFRGGVVSLSGVNAHDVVGLLSCDRKDFDLRLDPAGGSEERDYASTFKNSIEAFMANYRQGKAPPISGEDGLFAMRMENAVVESARTERAIKL